MLTVIDDWVSSFQRVPKLLNSAFEDHGATAITKIGLGDVAAGDIFNDFDKWQDEELWSALGGNEETEEEAGMEVEIDTGSRRSKLRQDVKEAVVISNQLLTKEGVPEKRHIVLNLPTGMTYKTGDYLAVLPMNNSKNVRRVLKWAQLPWDTMLTIKSGANTTLPTGHPTSMMDILGMYVELSQPATRKVCFLDPIIVSDVDTFVEHRTDRSLLSGRGRSSKDLNSGRQKLRAGDSHQTPIATRHIGRIPSCRTADRGFLSDASSHANSTILDLLFSSCGSYYRHDHLVGPRYPLQSG